MISRSKRLAALVSVRRGAEQQSQALLSFRPYGRDYISSQASTFALAGDRVAEIKLGPPHT